MEYSENRRIERPDNRSFGSKTAKLAFIDRERKVASKMIRRLKAKLIAHRAAKPYETRGRRFRDWRLRQMELQEERSRIGTSIDTLKQLERRIVRGDC